MAHLIAFGGYALIYGSLAARPEADAMARYLTARGVSGHAIVRERRSRNTAENLRNCLRELNRRGIDPELLRITVVTSNFHVLRTAGLTRRLGIDAQVLVGTRDQGRP
ncbi:YdcF family protein [Nocardia violaceofusca]|uniref:YdcF family protein n=1 Tax=Nocardia violaceofusca TaxID=941182 RepID=UPI000A00FAD6|nr:YdcF family protein [Nocardia violaceofusca]